ncbi:MAG: hypothetical protein ACK2UW_10505 [Anaerolineales bacterium]|jgi:hypothetical protein
MGQKLRFDNNWPESGTKQVFVWFNILPYAQVFRRKPDAGLQAPADMDVRPALAARAIIAGCGKIKKGSFLDL